MDWPRIVSIATNLGTIITVFIVLARYSKQRDTDIMTIEKLRQDVDAHRVNRLIFLERYADESIKYRRELRQWLISYVDVGAIDMTKIDMSTMPQPPQVPLIGD